MTEPDILVQRQKIHGAEASDYAAILRNRLPDRNVVLPTSPYEEREYAETARVITGDILDPTVLETAENLELYACVYAGTGHLDIDAFERHDVAVTNAAGVHGPNISEYVIGMMIAHARRFSTAWRNQQQRRWHVYPVSEVYDSTVAIVGLGAIGEAIVDRLDPFGVDTVGVRYTPEKGGPTDEVYGFDEIHEAVSDAEYVVLACPLTETTAGLVDEDLLRSMPIDAVLINVARGGVVDTDDLLWALQKNYIRSATLDVTDPEPLPEDHPLWGLDNVTITPHNAGSTPAYFDRCAEILVENLSRLDSGQSLRNSVV